MMRLQGKQITLIKMIDAWISDNSYRLFLETNLRKNLLNINMAN